MLVRFIEQHTQLRTRYSRVRFEPAGALLGPVRRDPPGSLRGRDLEHHSVTLACAGDVRPGDIHARPETFPLIDRVLETQILVRRGAPRGSHACHTLSQLN